MVIDGNQLSSAHNNWVQLNSNNKTTKTTPHNNRPKRLLLKVNSYLSIGHYDNSKFLKIFYLRKFLTFKPIFFFYKKIDWTNKFWLYVKIIPENSSYVKKIPAKKLNSYVSISIYIYFLFQQILDIRTHSLILQFLLCIQKSTYDRFIQTFKLK